MSSFQNFGNYNPDSPYEVGIHPLWIFLSLFPSAFLYMLLVVGSLYMAYIRPDVFVVLQNVVIIVAFLLGLRIIYRYFVLKSIRYRLNGRSIMVRSGIFYNRHEIYDRAAGRVDVSQNPMQHLVNSGNILVSQPNGGMKKLRNLGEFNRVQRYLTQWH